MSLVAERDGNIIGHILSSPVAIASLGNDSSAVGLGPLAVLLDSRGQGVGSHLTKAGIESCAKAGYELVVVL